MRSLLKSGIAALAMMTAVAAQAQDVHSHVPTPKSVLGHDVGEDYYLATYDEEIAYFHKLAAASDRMKMFTAGKTTQGRTFEYAVISSPANLAKYDHYKEVSRRLGDPRGMTDAQAKKLAADSKIIVHIDGGMHSSEVADHQLPMALAYKLLSAKDDAEIDKILEDVILVLWPTLNPDGQTMIVDWYRKYLGTPYETSSMPWLYQDFVGHDNNRDGYMLNMIETRAITAIEQEISPVIWYSHHQVAPFPARIWMPPFADPVSSNISPYMRIWTNAIGTNMMTRFEKEQKPGAIAMARFDNWYPGFLDYTHVFRNTISFFTETAHSSATPKNYPLEDFPRNMKDLKAQIWYPHPWEGGDWHLKDTVDYMMTASMSVLETAQKYRDTLLYNRYQAGRDAVKLYSTKGPFAYVIPSGQTDMPEAASLAQLMISHGLDVHQLKDATTIGGASYPAGSFVVLMAQPFAGLAKELFEAQKYPDAILDGSGKPVDLPYDVTGWTLPMQMGVTVNAVTTPIEPGLADKLTKIAKAQSIGGVTGTGNSYVLSRKVNDSYKVLNATLAAGGKAWFAKDDQSIVLSGISRPAIQKLSVTYGVEANAVAKAPAGDPVGKGRVGLYRPWGSNMEEGWTRWVFEQYGFGTKSVRDADVKAGLAGKYDTIILPDINGSRQVAAGTTAPVAGAPAPRRGPIASLINGLNVKDVPAEYAGGIGEDGGAALKKFVENGGTLIAMNNASDAVIDLFDLPVTNILKNVSSDEFFCSGALLELELDPATAATAGMPAKHIVMFERGPAFATKEGFKGKVIASYAPTGNPLRSGVLLHPEKIQGQAAALEVHVGKGKIYLYGFEPTWRGQSHASYKLLFNLMYKN